MGYTTRFVGSFKLDHPFTETHAEEMIAFNRDEWPGQHPDSWCQWEPTKDRAGIQWDGGEKFYHWDEWLTFVVNEFLTPRGYTLFGSVTWSGEGQYDVGVLSVVNGKVIKGDLPTRAWETFSERTRSKIIESLENAMLDYDGEEREAFRSLLATLGHVRRGRGHG